jgi:hypothetical protein
MVSGGPLAQAGPTTLSRTRAPVRLGKVLATT